MGFSGIVLPGSPDIIEYIAQKDASMSVLSHFYPGGFPTFLTVIILGMVMRPGSLFRLSPAGHCSRVLQHAEFIYRAL